MMPEVLFAPWRYEYLVAEKSSGCIFCRAAASGNAEESLVVYRGRKVFVLLNRYPYTNGHVMVAPYAHEAWLSDSSEETLTELVQAVAGVTDHYHVHVVPRWSGDTNFMTVAGDVRVVPEELSATRRKLEPLFAG